MEKKDYDFLKVPLQNKTIEGWLDLVLEKSRDGWRLYASEEQLDKAHGVFLREKPFDLVFCMDMLFSFLEKANKEGVVYFARTKSQ